MAVSDEKFKEMIDKLRDGLGTISELRLHGYKVEVTLRDPKEKPDEAYPNVNVFKQVY